MSSIFKDDKRWIIQSLLDVDFYKFTMGAFVYQYYRGVEVTFRLKNRTKGVRLAEIIDLNELRTQLDHVRELAFTSSETFYLRGMDLYKEHMFSDEYIRFLRTIQLSAYTLSTEDGQIVFESTGPWEVVTFWETIALGIINELYYRSMMASMSRFQRQAIYADGIRRLHRKIEILRQHPRITFVEFGTRRRFGRVWQSDITRALAEELPLQLRGTSNTRLACELNLVPMGTNAHELQMVAAALANSDDELFHVPNRVADQWFEMYGQALSIVLPDTFGSNVFLEHFGRERAIAWKGIREDSSDPYVAGAERIKFYQRHEIDPRTKLWLPSDGLDIETIVGLDAAYGGKMIVSYGWGTTLTNDLGLPTLSLVAKAVRANGRPTVKLSDNLAKAMGPLDEIERYKRVFGYQGSTFDECKV